MSEFESREANSREMPESAGFRLASAVLRTRRSIVVLAVAGGFAGLAFGLLKPRQYSTTVSFVPQTAPDQGGTGGLVMAASQLGVRLPSSSSGWGSAVYAELLRSRGLLAPIADDTIAVSEEGNARIAVADLFKVKASTSAQRREKTIQVLRARFSAVEDKKLGAVKIRVETKWPSVSYAIAQGLIRGVNTFNVQTRQSQAKAERQFAEDQAREAERALRQAEDRMQSFLQRNRVIISPELAFERDRFQRDITLRQQAYTVLLQNTTEARLREVRDTPVITILDQPAVAVMGEARSSVQKAAAGALVGGMLALGLALLSGARASSTEAAREFFRLLDAATPRFLRRFRSS